MIGADLKVEIRRLFYAEHWKVGTIASHLGVHYETVQAAVATDAFHRPRRGERASLVDPYRDFVKSTLAAYPALRSTRLYDMVKARGYPGSVVQLRRVVATMRPTTREAFLSLRVFPGEQAQVDWASFGTVTIGRAQRKLSGFVLTLSHSRALYLEFFLDQSLPSFLQAHVHALHDLGGVPRILLTDNLKSAVLARMPGVVRFNNAYLDLCAHYHTAPRPCAVAKGNEKGRVERAIQYIRHAFFAARPFTTLSDFNRQALLWRDEVAHQRPWAGDDHFTVAQAFEEERPALLPLPKHPFEAHHQETVRANKSLYVRFDLNDYSIPPEAICRTLTIIATVECVRILDGDRPVATHVRCWDRHAVIEDPAHRQALLTMKRRAIGQTPLTRLQRAAPQAEAFLLAASKRQLSVGGEAKRLLKLLDLYGQDALRLALAEALERQTPSSASVELVLEQNRRAARKKPPLPLDLTDRPELSSLHLEPQSLETYDALAATHDPDPEN
ncbi:MAG: IS21 family transposase [Thermoanaerobaculia bacterium]